MAPKRRDNKGRILQIGEWQEPNGRYRYMYNDALGKRKIVYSWRLTEADPVPAHRRKDIPLREKEKQVMSLFMQGISGSDMTVVELVERYISLKSGVKQSTLANYKTVINNLKKTEFAYRHEDQVKLSDAKMFLISLQRNGLGYSSIHNIRGVLRPALKAEYPNHFIPGQFVNLSNVKAHEESTGPEIFEDTNGQVDFLVSAVGTGGTLTGTAAYLKKKNPKIKVVAVEPENSSVLSGGKAGSHGIQGIGICLHRCLKIKKRSPHL